MPRFPAVLRLISRSRFVRAIRALGAVLTLLTSVTPAWSHQGRWTPPSDPWAGIAVHMSLVRGDGAPYHSRVIWWQSEGSNSSFVGGQWGWKQNFGNQDCTSYPSTALIGISMPNPGNNLFCSGLSGLMDGRLATIGGTEFGTENGLKVTNIFSPGAGTGTGSWATGLDSMANGRYYSTATALADGRLLASSGSRYPHIEFFGGRKDGATTPGIDSILRYGNAFKGTWDPSIAKQSGQLWPEPLTGLSTVMMRGYGAAQYFGGRNSGNQLTGKVWALHVGDQGSGDYSYVWTDQTPPTSPDQPDPRMDHAVVVRRDNTQAPDMIVIGGLAKALGQPEAATNDVWRHCKKASGPGYRWQRVGVTNPGDSPSARLGLTAVMDVDHDQALVFGGKSTSGTPSDYSVYALKFTDVGDSVSATWSEPKLATGYGGLYPDPRYHHSMQIDVIARKYVGTDLKSAVLFGGAGAGGTLFNDVWRLWIHAAGDTVHWEEVEAVGDLPTVREGHTGTYESGSALLFVFGGTTTGGAATDGTVKAIDLDNNPPTWRAFAARGYSLAGHTAVIGPLIFARSPEIYTVGTNEWAPPSSAHAQKWYPQMFQMPLPNGKVFASGPDRNSYTFNPSNGVWEEFPVSSPPTHEIVGGGAVMYGSGLVMKAGSRDTEAIGSAASDTTTWIDLTAGSPAWASGGRMFVGRVNHNLTILPSGNVLATGGLGTIADDQNINPRRRPEIWSASSHTWSGGSDALPDSVAISSVPRGYHSTALLLPDGRVLCAGGNELDGVEELADIFCPPYLFNSNGTLATRPTLVSATGRWRYNKDVTFSVSGDTSIRRACLIHAGATTHAQDQAQRYVPLTLLSSSVRSDGVRQYFLKAPVDSFTAPPGDYLLFASNSAGVPSIAQWVRVGSAESGQFDTTGPDELTFSTTFIYCDAISPIYWTAPGDNGNTGTALDYDIRYSWSPITASNFANATPLPGAGIPLLAGTIQTGIGFSGLAPATNLYVAGKASDKAGHLTPLTITQFATLSSCGGGGYGESVRRARDEDSRSRTSSASAGGGLKSRAFAPPSSVLPSSSPLRLVGEFERGGATRWQLAYRNLTDDPELLQVTSNQVVVQEQLPGGGWWTQSSAALPAGPVGVRSLARNGRVVFPYGTSFESVELEPRGFICTEGEHSRLGDVLQENSPEITSEFSTGDTLTIAYSTSTQPGGGEDCFFRVRVPGEARATAARPRSGLSPRTPDTEALPVAFALHTARPNPFSNITTMRFDLPKSAEVSMEVFDVQGRLVAVLARGVHDAGRHSVVWDGRTEGGGRASAGIYLCRMTAGEFVAEGRVSLLP